MNIRNVPVNTPLLDGNEKKYINEALDTGWISSEGPFVSQFEKMFSQYCGQKFGVAVSNGTVALDIAVRALGIGSGDEVIVPTFTIISCASSVVQSGATPVFVDCGKNDFNIDVTKIEEMITPKTKAIMVVHLYGLPADMDAITHIAKKHNLKIIEDAAQAHGLMYKGQRCGSFGDVATFSFYPNKHITTGEGGMILTSNPELLERLQSLRNLCFNAEKRFYHTELGTNGRMTNMQAAMGVGQLEKIENKLEKKKWIGKTYLEKLQSVKNVVLPPAQGPYGENLFWVFYLLIDKEIGITAQSVMEKLATKKIGTRPFFYPLHKQPCFKHLMNSRYDHSKFSNSNDLYDRGFYIPSGLGLTIEDIDYVSDAINQLFSL